MSHVHVIPVDESLTAEEAWREICLMGCRTTYTGSEKWATIVSEKDPCTCLAEVSVVTA